MKIDRNHCVIMFMLNVHKYKKFQEGENELSQALIFDMDGTLFQTDKILEISLDDTFHYLRSIHQWDGETPIDKYREIMGVPLPIVWETLLPHHSLRLREEIDAYFLERLVTNIKNGKGALYPNVKEVFSYLKENGFSIYIASNGLTAYLQAIIDYYQLDKWVTEAYSIQDIESLNKSDLVCKIINEHEITPAAVVGDRLSDIKAAKENNLFAIGCNFDFAKDDELKQADIVIDDLIELTSILKASSVFQVKNSIIK